MVQRTIDQYFHRRQPRSSSAKASFLTLPFSIRRLIYAELGLPLPQTVHLNYSPPFSRIFEAPCLFLYPTLDPSEIPPEEILTIQSSALSNFLDSPPTPSIHLDRRCDCGEEPYEESCERRWCSCISAPSELLYISHKIEEEVRYVFWSEHTFTVCMSDIGGLDVLYALPGNAVQQMTSLVIRLNVYECENGFRCKRWDCELYCHPGCRSRGHDNFINKARSGYFKPVLREWKKMCEFLAKRILPGKLKLAFICDTDDVETAEEIVLPMKQLPALKECAIRLGILPIGNTDVRSKLQQIAGKTAQQLTKRWIDRPFRFLDLPQEIQFQILSYTELVASHDLQHVSAGCVSGRNPVAFFERVGVDFDKNGEDILNATECCGKCVDASEICLCQARHAAFSTTCTCWRMPTAIFQVSQKMRNDAESIFYSLNHFHTPEDTWSCKVLPILQFLQRIPPRAVKYLQHVTSMNPYRHADLDPGRYQWLEVLDILVREGNFPKFNLTLDLASQNRYAEYDERMGDLPPEKVIDNVMMGYLLSGKALAELIKERGRLKNFFFHVSWPLQRVDQDACRRQRETEIERIAMGERYDSVANGKYKRRHAWNGHPCGEVCSACPPREEDRGDMWN
jgi:hypothetical protein